VVYNARDLCLKEVKGLDGRLVLADFAEPNTAQFRESMGDRPVNNSLLSSDLISCLSDDLPWRWPNKKLDQQKTREG